MTWTYDLANADQAIVKASRVRFWLYDTTEDKGVKPDGKNLSDEEIAMLVEQEKGHLMRTVAAGCELLAIAWGAKVDADAGPLRAKFSQTAAAYADRAKTLRSA